MYRNLQPGGYWGIANMFTSLGISDKCIEEGGQWRCRVITHYTDQAELEMYEDPEGTFKRVRHDTQEYLQLNNLSK